MSKLKVSPEIVKAATTAVGTVDLQEVVRGIEADKAAARERRRELKQRRQKVVEVFAEAYTRYFGGQFDFRKKRQWRTWKDRNGRTYKRRQPTDEQALWQTWSRVVQSYDGTTIEFERYIDWACQLAVQKYEVVNPRQIFGFVNNDGVVDEYFMRARANAVHGRENQRIKDRAAAHADLFKS